MHALEAQPKHRTIYRSEGMLCACLIDICRSISAIKLKATSKAALKAEVTAEGSMKKVETAF